ncbi:MAG: hypothetical protein HQ472_00035 [Ignavibacteria bacterium]|nr:hypothetical protein [Ignavibacteria bacterium]
MDDLPSETRLIVTDATWSIPFNHGHGIGTRIDPELYVHPATLEVDKETGLNTGALHGFSHAPIGTVGAGGKYIELRDTAAADTLYGNTNTRVMFRSGNINQEYIQKIFVSDTETIERKYIDPCETGEFLWVGATLRRPGSQSIGNSTDTVMRIFVRRQRQRKKLSEIWTEPFKVCPDSIEYVDVENTLSHPYELGFSYIPEQPTGSGDIARIGIDSLPKMTPQLDTVLFHPTNIFNRLETELRTTQVIPTFVDSTREHVWKRYVDVRNDSGRYKSIVITRGILNALLPASTGPGSAWTEFDALLVLPADSTDKFTPSHFSKKYVANQTLLTLANRHTGVLNLAMPERRNSEHNG